MGYTITNVETSDDKLNVGVEFTCGEKGVVQFEPSTAMADILARLDEIDANWPTTEDSKLDLPEDLKDLVGYNKA